MRYITASLMIGLALFLTACVPSLHPLYTEKDLTFDPALLGEWRETKPDSKSTLTFTQGEGKAYKLTSKDGSDKAENYIAHLVKLGDKRFLDVKPDPSPACDWSGLRWHMFFLVSQTEPTLRLWDLNDEWVETLLKKNPAALKHEIVDGDLLLTASTKQLQDFVLRNVSTKGVFTDPVDYARKR
ncbi:MAG TPA: hypothetical protein VJH03_05040 [Blastocatellia bacterium]|nr:hypothetical protein [Blastocatellia bacterium]